ncbi:MAG: hypothetical protein IH919_09005, partial [Deltaproteobacteria bacterium]|nr:hypothetical protein [Deltaproteobacteria bacterium]
IDAPKVYFVAKLAHSSAYVVDRANVEEGAEEWWREPNGTGAFKLKGWTDNLVLALERNDDYHLTPAKVPYVVFRLLAGIPFGGIPSLMYETGEVDAARNDTHARLPQAFAALGWRNTVAIRIDSPGGSVTLETLPQ